MTAAQQHCESLNHLLVVPLQNPEGLGDFRVRWQRSLTGCLTLGGVWRVVRGLKNPVHAL
jgi:hypothetical protein